MWWRFQEYWSYEDFEENFNENLEQIIKKVSKMIHNWKLSDKTEQNNENF